MTKAVSQQAPFAVMALMVGIHSVGERSVLASSNVASMEWRTATELPTQCFTCFPAAAPMPEIETAGLALRGLASVVLHNNRPMESWERKVADDFFWAQFE